MRRQRHCKWVSLLVIVTFLMIVGWPIREIWAVEKYPTKPITIVVGFTPGQTDVSLRVATDWLPEYLGKPAIFVYKPGAQGSIGHSFVAKSEPDGYTLMGTSAGGFILPPITQDGLDYTIDNFVPICRFESTSMFLAVSSESPFKTLKDIIEEAKKSPGKLTYVSAGLFSGQHVATFLLSKAAGIDLTHVPCTGTSESVKAALGGHASMLAASGAAPVAFVKTGQLRLICVYAKKRMREFPDIPTATELGYPVVVNSWYGILAPKGTPEEVVRTLITTFEKIVKDHKDSMEEKARNLGLELEFEAGEEFGNSIKEMDGVYRKVIADLGKPPK